MKKQDIEFNDLIQDEFGLGRSRSEMTDDIIPGSHKEPPITIEEESVLDELGLGRDPAFRDIVEQNEENVDKQ